MTDDIVERLRSIGRLRTMDLGNIPTVAQQAADEIERLRAENERLRAEINLVSK